MASRGYSGAILRVDLSTGRSSTLETEQYARRFIGGRGLATAIYWDEVPPEVGALDPENRLILVTGPVAGVPAVGGSRWGIYARSPLPGREHFSYGSLGGSFGAELKLAGYDAVIIQGRADRPVSLLIRPDGVRILDASAVWGLATDAAMAAMQQQVEGRSRVLAIGPAGENLVPFATVFADGDASCSGGMGAVMGSKRIKAIAVQATERRVQTADPEGLRRMAKEIKSFGRGNVKVWGFDFMAHGPKTEKITCHGCMGDCLRVRYTADNGKRGKYMCQSRFFYYPYAILFHGEENDVPFLANRACDEQGLDTWAIQDLVDWLVRCHEEGLVSEEQSGLPLSEVGGLELVQRLVEMTASRQGFGELMARGAAGAAAELGTAQLELARIHDPYEPRYCNVNTFLFPFEPRKPIQQLHEAGLVLSQWSSWLQGVEGAHISSEVFRGIAERFWGGAEAADLTTLRGKPLAARKIQDRQYAKESLVVCDWMYPVIDNPQGEDHVGDPTFESRILAAVTGEPWDEASLARAGERVFNLQRAILLREGHRAAEDDLLPPEWHEKPLEGHIADVECNVPGPDGQPVSRVGERVEMEAYLEARREYYRLRGWDPATGLQSPALLRELQLPEAAEALAGLGLLAEPDRLS